MSETLGGYDQQRDSNDESLRCSLESKEDGGGVGAGDSDKPSASNRPLSIITDTGGHIHQQQSSSSGDGSLVKRSKGGETRVDVSPIKSSKSSPPEVPTSPLSSTYIALSQKLVSLVSPSSSVASPEFCESVEPGNIQTNATFSATGSMMEEEEANIIRTKIARILHQIQIAVNNPAVNIFCFRPVAIAFQLCVIEHTPSLQAVSDFFNYFTRQVECSILQQMDIPGRIKTIQKWFKVASYLKKFNNFQSLRGITSAMTTPPIIRLKKTWTQLRKKNSAEVLDFEELSNLVSEQNNYNTYRNFIKNNQTRPMVPFIGVILHDMTYLIAATKEPASDKRVLDIQKFIRYCSLGPRYSYEMLIDLDIEKMTNSFTGTPGLHQKKNAKRKVKGGGLSEQGLEVLGGLFKDCNEEDIGSFIAHWILTRKWVSEKEVDEMSLFREPRASPIKNPTIPANDPAASLSNSVVEQETTTRQSKTEDDFVVREQTATLLKPKEVSTTSMTATLAPASPNLSRIKAMGGSNSFIEAIKETAYTLVSKNTKPVVTSGTSSPASNSLTNSAKQIATSKASATTTTTKLNSELPRGRQLDQLLRRRQKSLSNLDIDTLPGGSKSISMDTGINSRSLSPERAKDADKAGSFDSISGSICQSTVAGLIPVDDTAITSSAYVEGFHGVESEELKRKLEILVNATTVLSNEPEPQLRRRSSSGSAAPSTSAPYKEAPANHRHGFFSSFFSYNDDGVISSSDTSNAVSRISELKPQKSSKLDAIKSTNTEPNSSSTSLEGKESVVQKPGGFFSFTKSPQTASQFDSSSTTPVVDLKATMCQATTAHQPDILKEKPLTKSRRRASSAGTVEAVNKIALDSQNKEATRDSVPEETSNEANTTTKLVEQIFKDIDSKTTESSERNSLGTIKPLTPNLRAVKGSKRPSTDPADKLVEPVLPTSQSTTPGVLSWSSKFSKSGTKTPVALVPTPSAASLDGNEVFERIPNFKPVSRVIFLD
ncbi:UNVERIFIED_CONTAM: hypothetical protein HDU68_007269 [Siphonaria sp. JEL0065]|nr:hypothetical protein HDU68_007269 [Siphonaria sp. JEL0065]